MFRHFQIVSDELAYSSNESDYEFPTVLRHGAKGAIIGVDIHATSPVYALQNTLDKLQVASRSYVQGDPFLLGLLTPAARLMEDKSGGSAGASLAAQTLPDALTDSTGATADTTLQKTVVASGIHTWAGGAATADSIAVAGILATDVVLVNIVTRGANSPTSVIGVIDTANGQVDLVLDANGVNDSTEIAYIVLRGATEIDENVADLAAQQAKNRTQLSTLRDSVATLAAAINSRGPGGATHPYFPGTGLVLEEGQAVGGIPIQGGETIRMKLTDLTGGSAQITRVVLHCVEFATDCPDMGDSAAEMWRRFHDRGEGALLFVGDLHSYSAAFTQSLEVEPKGVHTNNLRRVEVLGAIDDAAGVIREADFQALTVQLSTTNQPAPTKESVPARSIIGHSGLHHRGAARVDLQQGDRSRVYVVAPAPTTGTNKLRLCHVFEGRPQGGRLTSSRAVS